MLNSTHKCNQYLYRIHIGLLCMEGCPLFGYETVKRDIFDQFISVGVIAIIIIFQSEIRQFLLRLGSQTRNRRWLKLLLLRSKEDNNTLDVTPIV